MSVETLAQMASKLVSGCAVASSHQAMRTALADVIELIWVANADASLVAGNPNKSEAASKARNTFTNRWHLSKDDQKELSDIVRGTDRVRGVITLTRDELNDLLRRVKAHPSAVILPDPQSKAS